MKILNENEKRIKYIDITIEFVEELQYLAASNKLTEPQHPKNIDAKYRLTNEQLRAYADFVHTIYLNIKNMGYEIIGDAPTFTESDVSYSKYIQFSVIGNDDITYIIRFRISDHKSTSIPNNDNVQMVSTYNDVLHRREIIRSITIGDNEEFTSYTAAINGIWEILHGLSHGYIDILNTNYKSKEFDK